MLTYVHELQISRREFEEIYELLDIDILERGESFCNHMIPDVLDELTRKEIAVKSDGALCIFRDEDEPPLICRKSDGGFNYASTDLAALWQVGFPVNVFQQSSTYNWFRSCNSELLRSVLIGSYT